MRCLLLAFSLGVVTLQQQVRLPASSHIAYALAGAIASIGCAAYSARAAARLVQRLAARWRNGRRDCVSADPCRRTVGPNSAAETPAWNCQSARLRRRGMAPSE